MTSFAEAYEKLVRDEITKLSAYSGKQQDRYRLARVVVIVSAGSVPVLAGVPAAPKWVLGVVGAIAAATASIEQLFQWRRTSLNAMKTANELERELNRYVAGVREYATDPSVPDAQHAADSLFIERVEAIRESADKAFIDIWQRPTADQASLPAKPQAQPGGQH
jgi:hypothetical protein